MKAMLQTKIGLFLIVSSVLAAWTLLAARPALAQRTPTPPSCPSSSEISNLTDSDNATTPSFVENGDITIKNKAGSFTAELKNGEIKSGTTVDVDYFRIKVPDLVVGELSVGATGALTRSVARLCKGSSTVATDPDTSSNTKRHFGFLLERVTPGDYFVVVSGQDVDADGARVSDNTKISSGKYALNITFDGVLPTTDETPPAAGSLTSAGERDSYALTTTMAGLLTVQTTGSTDTKGELFDDEGKIVTAEAGGSGGNFQMVVPVLAGKHTVYVEGQSATVTGDYTLDVDFYVAKNLSVDKDDKYDPDSVAYKKAMSDDGDIERGKAEYFLITVPKAAYGFMTVKTVKHTDASGTGTDTEGTLYGPSGQIATDDDSGADSNFLIQAPVSPGDYIVKVEGRSSSTTGKYTLEVSTEEVKKDEHITSARQGDTQRTAPHEIKDATGSEALQVDYHSIGVTTAGTLQVQTTGPVDTVGVLYGPDGAQLATDDNGGATNNFKITESVTKGQYIVTVRGATRATAGKYNLVVNFIEGAALGGTNGRVAELEAEVERLEAALEDCPTAVVTHAKGFLENPSNDGFRSGIGIISGWVCAASDVEVQILSDRGVLRETLDVAYGTSRADTVGQCRHRSANTGFGMTYNFNHLPEGMHTIRAYADDEQIGEDETFEVVHLTTFAANDDDRFLRNLPAADECRVDDFPAAGEDTFLKWEESIQNFVIEDAG